MTIKDCIDIVDNIKPNQYTIKDKVSWISFIEEIIINEVLKTHEGYDGRYDNFEGYSEDKLSVTLIVPSPFDRLYPEYIKMMIDKENGETARYNNSAASYNTFMSEYRKHYNKTHMPLNTIGKRVVMPQKQATIGLSGAEYENLKKDLTFILTEFFSDVVSADKLYDVVMKYAHNNVELLKGKKGDTGDKGDKGDQGPRGPQGVQGKKGDKGEEGYTPQKGIDYYTPTEKQELIDEISEEVTNQGLKDITSKEFVGEEIVVGDVVAIGGTIKAGQTISDFKAHFADGTIGTKDGEYLDGSSGIERDEIILDNGDIVLTSHDLPYTCDRDLSFDWAGFTRASDLEVASGTSVELIINGKVEIVTDQIATRNFVKEKCGEMANKDLTNVTDQGMQNITSKEFAIGELREVAPADLQPGDVIVDFKAYGLDTTGNPEPGEGKSILITKYNAIRFGIVFYNNDDEKYVTSLPYTVDDKPFGINDVHYIDPGNPSVESYTDYTESFIVCDGIDKIATTKEVEEKVGDIEAVLDGIIAIQNALIGGDSV